MNEKVNKYPIFKRYGYGRRNNFFPKKFILHINLFGIKRFNLFKVKSIPTDIDIHFHNIWKDCKK